ncbi:MAG: alkaline phosphatase family protein [Acidobacteria bacterium]|nr:alkaline phosphatase family protein [Acidobacteriota bacterium]
MRRKAIIIALDGATFELLGPWIEQGRLPHLKAMMRDGVSGELRTIVPPVTAPAWASFMTGKNPGKHGLFDFVVQDKTTYQFHPVNSRMRHGKVLWEEIGEQGGRVAVLNVPLTHPPYSVNGALISDFLLATGQGGASFPAELISEIQEQFGPYPSDAVVPYFVVSQADEDVRRFVQEYTQALEYKFQVLHYLREKLDPDFVMLHLYGNDQIGHWLWHIFDETHPRYRKEESQKQFDTVFAYYRAFDANIGRLRECIDKDTSVFIISDHGFGPVYKAIDLNTWLHEEGYLVLKPQPMTTLRQMLWNIGLTPNSASFMTQSWIARSLGKVARRWVKDSSQGGVDRVMQAHNLAQLLLSFNDIDWARTKAFSPFGFGQIRINVRGEWAQGCVSPGAEYEQIKQGIVEKLRALKDPETGQPMDAEVVTKDEIYSGDFFDVAPDIFFVPVNGQYRPKSAGFTSNKVISHFYGMTGVHKLNGILMAHGAAFHRGQRIEGARIIDLFPSILYLMGMAIPDDVDGVVLHQAFAESFLQHHPIRFAEKDGDLAEQTRDEVARQDEETVIERLRGLGYLD